MTYETLTPKASAKVLTGPYLTKNDPEASTVEAFVEYHLGNEVEVVRRMDLLALAMAHNITPTKAGELVREWGLSIAEPVATRETRGFRSNSHNLWHGNPCSGGSGHEQICGWAGRQG